MSFGVNGHDRFQRGSRLLLRRATICILILLITALAPLFAETVRTQSRLNLRQEPSTASARVALLPPGFDLEVLSRRGLWIRVKSGAGEGWVHSDYVISTGLLEEASPEKSLRDAELAREVALIRVERLERELEGLRQGSPPDTARLRSQLEQRDQRIAQLEGEVAAAAASADSADAARDAELRARLATTLGERDDLTQRLAVAQNETEGAKRALAEASAGRQQAADLASERDQAVERVEQLQGELAATRQQLEVVRSHLAGEASQRQDLTTRMTDLESDLMTARQELETVRSQQAGEASQREGLAAKVTGLESDLTTARQELEVVRAQQVGETSQRQDLTAKVADLESDLVTARQELARRVETIARLEDRALASEAAAEDSAQSTAASVAAAEQRQQEHAHLKTQFDQLVAEQASLSTARDSLSGERDRLAAEKATWVEQRAGLVGEKDRLAEENEGLAVERTNLSVEKASLLKRVAGLEAELAANQGSLVEQSTRFSVLEAEHTRATASLRSRLTATEADLGIRTTEREALSRQVVSLEAEMESLRSDQARGASGQEALQTRVSTLEGELTAARTLAGQREAQVRELTAEAETDDELHSKVALHKAESARFETELNGARTALTQAESALEALRADLGTRTASTSKLGEELTVARDSLGEQARQISALKTQLAEKDQLVAADRAEWNQRVEAAEAESLRLVRHGTELEMTLALLDEQVSSFELAARAETGDIEGLEDRLASVVEERRTVEGRQAGLRQELADAKTQRDQSIEHAVALETEAKRLAGALLELQEWSDEAERVVERLNAANTDLEQQVATLKGRRGRRGEPAAADLREAQARASAAEQSAEAAERQVESLREQLAQATAQVADAAASDQISREREEPVVVNEVATRAPESARPAPQPTVVVSEPLASEPAFEPLVTPAAPIAADVAVPDVDPAAEAVAVVENWSEAWSSQDVERYLTFYDASFTPSAGTSRDAWAAQRRQRLARPSFIQVELSSFFVQSVGPERKTISFDQAYRSNTFNDQVRKTLEMVRREDGWKIVREASQ